MQLRVTCGIFRQREGLQNEPRMIILYSYVLCSMHEPIQQTVALFTCYTSSSAYDVFR
jgi:hypothetical protein